MSLHIEGRRWFQRGPGNTYHSVRIWADGKQVAYLPFAYGYGDGFLQTAVEWLRQNCEALHLPGVTADMPYGTLHLRENCGGTYSVIDVTRKGDL